MLDIQGMRETCDTYLGSIGISGKRSMLHIGRKKHIRACIKNRSYEKYCHVDDMFTFSGCDRGYFRNSTNNGCAVCAIGTYSDTHNADSCTSCPEGETTSQEGSTSSSQCG